MPHKDREQRLEAQRRAMKKRREDPEFRKEEAAYRKEKRKELVYRLGRWKKGRPTVPIAIRRALCARANNECESTSETPCKGNLCIHHIDGDAENNELSNLLLLCARHHNKDEHGLGTAVRGRNKPPSGLKQ